MSDGISPGATPKEVREGVSRAQNEYGKITSIEKPAGDAGRDVQKVKKDLPSSHSEVKKAAHKAHDAADHITKPQGSGATDNELSSRGNNDTSAGTATGIPPRDPHRNAGVNPGNVGVPNGRAPNGRTPNGRTPNGRTPNGGGATQSSATSRSSRDQNIRSPSSGTSSAVGSKSTGSKSTAGSELETSSSKKVSKERLEAKAKYDRSKEKTIPDPEFQGWKEVGGWDDRLALEDEEELEDLLAKSTLLEDYIKDKFYGDWYHNTAVVFISTVLAYYLGKWGGQLPWLILVFLLAGTIYRTSIRRLRTRYRDDITREFGLKKLETDTESLEWLNSFLVKFWLIYEPELSKTVIAIANPQLQAACPGFLESISLDTFTLGTKPPRVDHVRTFPRTDPDVAVMDWKFSFIPNDIEDLTARQLKSKVNPKVVLGVRVGKGVVSKSLPILVEDMTFSGTMRVRVKMISTFPHIQTVDVAFLEPPLIDFVLKPIGGDTFGFDINIVPGLSKFIKEMVDANAGPMIYAPNAFQLNVEQMLAGAGVDSAIGVVSIKIKNGQDLRGSDRFGNTVDPYVKFFIGDSGNELERSDVKSDTKNPVWNETKYILVKNLNDVLKLEIMDFNDFRNDKPIGVVNFNLDTLTSTPDRDNIKGQVLAGNKEKGILNYDVHFNKILEPRTLEDGTVIPPPESNTGIFKYSVTQVRDLDAKQSLLGQLSTYAEFYLDGKKLKTSKVVKKNNSPIFDISDEILIADKARAKITIVIRDSRNMKTDPIVAKYTSSLSSLTAKVEKGESWFKVAPAGEIKLAAFWKPVPLPELDGSAGYVPPIGAFRLTIKGARQLKNLERVGTIDPYARAFIGGMLKGRTLAADSTTNPDFDEVFYIPVQDISQDLTLEVMDVEKMGKDRTLGSADIDISPYVQTDAKGNYLPYDGQGKVLKADLSVANKAPRGTISYCLDFYPAVSILSPEEIQEKRKAEEEAKEDETPKEKKAAEKKERKQKKTTEKNQKRMAEEYDESESEVESLEEEVHEGNDAIELSLEEQLNTPTGVLAIIIEEINGNKPQTYLRVVPDDSNFPIYLSSVLRRSMTKLSEHTDYLVRELEHSEVTFELVSKPTATDEDDILLSYTLPAKKILAEAYEAPKIFTLQGSHSSLKVKLRARYFPVKMPLKLVDTINDQGRLRVDILEAVNVEAADRSGKSDPYVKVYHNGVSIYKTKEIKKTLNPKWNESVEFDLVSRTLGSVEFKVYDFDIGPGDDDFLGAAKLDLSKLEAGQAVQLSMALEGHRGELKVLALFTPKYIRAKSPKKDSALGSTIAMPGKLLTEAGGVPIKLVGAGVGAGVGAVSAVGAGAGGAVKGVGKGASGLVKGVFGRGSKKDRDNGHDGDTSSLADTSVASSGYGGLSSPSKPGHQRSNSSLSQGSAATGNGSSAEAISGHVSIGLIQGLPSGNYQLKVHVVDKKDKEIFKSKTLKGGDAEVNIDDNATFKSRPTGTLLFKLKEVHSLGKSKDVAEQSLSLTSTQPGPVPVSLGEASLQVQVDYNNKF